MERVAETALRVKTVIAGADVFAGDGILGSLPVTVAQLLEDGLIFLLYDKGTEEIAKSVCEDLKGYGFRVSAHDIAENYRAEEHCRLVLGVGAGKVAEETKRVAKSLGVECVLVVTAPSTDCYLRGGGVKQVYLDGHVLDCCPTQCTAAGWGILLSAPVTRFEDYFNEKVLACARGGKSSAEVPTTECDNTELALRLLEYGACNGDDGASDEVARLLAAIAVEKGKKPRLHGEYKFLAACTLSVFYSSFLSSPAIDTLPPADHDGALEELSRLTGTPHEKLVHSFDFFDVNSYFRINYILSEYRLDLLDRLSTLDLRSSQRRWRRLYEDAGYWLSGALTARDMLRAMSLAGETCKGLLNYAVAAGFCRRLVPPAKEKAA